MTNARLLASCLALLLTSVSALGAGRHITAVELVRSNNDEQVLAVTFDATPPTPTSFAIANPPRIAFDFADTGSALGKTQLELSGTYLNGASVIEAGERTRMVLNLGKSTRYATSRDGQRLLITLGGQQASGNAPREAAPPVPAATPAASSAGNEVSNIDFRRGAKGEARLVLDLPPGAMPDVRRNGRTLQVDLAGIRLPRQLERRLDVTDFGTPVTRVDAQTQGRGSRITLGINGEWEYAHYQTERQLIVEVRGLSQQEADSQRAQLGASPYTGDRLSLNFQNIEVRELLQTLAEFTKLNIIASDAVTGKITLRLDNIPWDQALDIILELKGLEKRRVGNVIMVAPQADLIKASQMSARSQQANVMGEPLVTEVFTIKYRTVEDVVKALKGLVSDSTAVTGSSGADAGNAAAAGGGTNASYSTELRPSMHADERTNKLIVRERPSMLKEIRDAIALIDQPLKQVLIEARIVEARDNFQRDLGVKLGFAKVGGDTSVGQGYLTTPAPGGSSPSLPVLPNINLPAGLQGGTIGVIYKSASAIIGLELQAMQAEDQGKIISSPRVLTADRTEAKIEEGTEIPYQSIDKNGNPSTSFKKANLSLLVKPQVTPDGDIILDLTINKDSVNSKLTVGVNPAIDNNQVQTQVRVENGGTVVIGGIYVQEQQSLENKVPLLGDIPLLGALFRNQSTKNNRREMLVFITPRTIESEPLVR